MKKIGKEVLFLSTGEKNPRNGEGSLLRLRDGRILYAYTQYYGDSWQDHATARVAAYYSSDEGETWHDGGILIEKDADALNIMSVSLMRMRNGDLGLLFLRKSMKGDDLLCMPYLVRSADEGKTFGTPVPCFAEDGYYVVNNDRLIRLKNGRLLIPAAYHGAAGNRGLLPGALRVCYSDDDGQSWTVSHEEVHSPFNDHVQLQEPGLYQLPDGRVWMWCRTAYGHQYQCFSADGGETWGGHYPLPVLHLSRIAHADQGGGSIHGGGVQSPLIHLSAPRYGRMGQSQAHPLCVRGQPRRGCFIRGSNQRRQRLQLLHRKLLPFGG